MVRNLLLARSFQFFHGIIEEKVYQNRIYLGLGVSTADLLAD